MIHDASYHKQLTWSLNDSMYTPIIHHPTLDNSSVAARTHEPAYSSQVGSGGLGESGKSTEDD